MQYLKRLSQLLLTAGGLSISLSAWADGTDSGTPVTNDVQMSFTVGLVPQTASSDVTFVVDRKLRLDVGTPNGNWVSAVPGQTGVTASSVQFVIDNNSNDSVEVVIALLDQGALDVDGYDPARRITYRANGSDHLGRHQRGRRVGWWRKRTGLRNGCLYPHRCLCRR